MPEPLSPDKVKPAAQGLLPDVIRTYGLSGCNVFLLQAQGLFEHRDIRLL